mgnify:CR=1 FL=1
MVVGYVYQNAQTFILNWYKKISLAQNTLAIYNFSVTVVFFNGKYDDNYFLWGCKVPLSKSYEVSIKTIFYQRY